MTGKVVQVGVFQKFLYFTETFKPALYRYTSSIVPHIILPKTFK